MYYWFARAHVGTRKVAYEIQKFIFIFVGFCAPRGGIAVQRSLHKMFTDEIQTYSTGPRVFGAMRRHHHGPWGDTDSDIHAGGNRRLG